MLSWCRVADRNNFDTSDLFDARNPRQVWICMLALGRAAHGITVRSRRPLQKQPKTRRLDRFPRPWNPAARQLFTDQVRVSQGYEGPCFRAERKAKGGSKHKRVNAKGGLWGKAGGEYSGAQPAALATLAVLALWFVGR